MKLESRKLKGISKQISRRTWADKKTAQTTVPHLLSVTRKSASYEKNATTSMTLHVKDAILSKVLKEIKSQIDVNDMDDEQKSRLKFDFKQCETAIYAWKAHLLRTVVQEEAKQDALSKLDHETCLIIADWAMKFLPLKYRENMSQFFGKR